MSDKIVEQIKPSPKAHKVKDGIWVHAFFPKDTEFIGFSVDHKEFPMLIRAGTLTRVLIPKEQR